LRDKRIRTAFAPAAITRCARDLHRLLLLQPEDLLRSHAYLGTARQCHVARVRGPHGHRLERVQPGRTIGSLLDVVLGQVRGDIVEVVNTVGSILPGTDGLGDWNIPWDQWRAGNANIWLLGSADPKSVESPTSVGSLT
jgi:hypothetical protein